MEFAVVFQGVSIPEREIGLDDVSFIRRKMGKNIPLEDIEEYTKKFNGCKIVISVSEDFARRHYDLFKKRNIFWVRMDEGVSNFCYRAIGVRRALRPHYYIYYKVDKEALLAAWEKAGCPEEM